MKELEQKQFENSESFRMWLSENYNKYDGLWLVFSKKGSKIKTISHNQALEQALCFGWIDSLIKKIDEQFYKIMFTPRTNTKNWSDINKKKVIELIKSGQMTEAGLNKIDIYLKTGKVDWTFDTEKINKNFNIEKQEFIMPEYILEQFVQNEPAFSNYNKLSKSHKKQYIMWITSAKRPETIQKRINQTITMLKNNEQLGLK